jgi:LAO/AO transport system kinase
MREDHLYLIDQLNDGVQRALARLLTLVENRDPGWLDVMKQIHPRTGRVPIVGLTGPAGAGKSTLVCNLAEEMVRKGYRPGIIAVDPSSPFSGGSLLGDRCRMRSAEMHPEIFIRSMGSRDGSGGLSPGVMNAARLIEAGGYDIILIETIGTGQDEIDIVHAANLVLLILSPGMGDIIQAFKAGMMEIADIFVVNKADKPGADQLAGEIQTMLAARQAMANKHPHIVKHSNSMGSKGASELAALVLDCLNEEQRLLGRRKNRIRWELLSHLELRIRQMVFDNYLEKITMEPLITEIIEGRTDIYSVIEKALKEGMC